MKFDGGKIREFRQSRGISHNQLMIAMVRGGIDEPPSPQLISAWETGRHMPGAHYLGLLAKFFQVPVDAFYTRDGQTASSASPSTTPPAYVSPEPVEGKKAKKKSAPAAPKRS